MHIWGEKKDKAGSNPRAMVQNALRAEPRGVKLCASRRKREGPWQTAWSAGPPGVLR